MICRETWPKPLPLSNNPRDLPADSPASYPVPPPPIDRLQGTDGIRRRVARSSNAAVNRLSPLEAYIQRGIITEQFLEQYAYAYCSGLSRGSEVVIGWDPRDTEGIFTSAVVSGVRKSGCAAVVVGVFPTPGIALYHIWRGAAASLAVTASHNPAEYNGLKIFQGPQAMKMFADEERELTRQVIALDYASQVVPLAPLGHRIDARAEALDVVTRFHLDPRNSWLAEGDTLGDFPLIVDAANGAYSGILANLLQRIHGGDVVEVNGDAASGQVNFRGGVTDLEGITEIHRAAPRFKDHAGVQAVLDRRGKGMVFDADGDRFFRLDYDPVGDKVLVGAGDRNALLQATFLVGMDSRLRGNDGWNDQSGDLFVTTVESDLNAYRAAEDMGFTTILTGVGDIRILRHAVDNPNRFAVGSEESGHTITPGLLTTRAGEDVRVFVTNGLKSAINTFVASKGKTPDQIHRTFPPGFKRNFVVYHVQKELFHSGSDVYNGVERLITTEARLGRVERVAFDDEPDLLYLAMRDADGHQNAAVFVRNSGTEDRVGVSVRGRLGDLETLTSIGIAIAGYLAGSMKDRANPMALAEQEVLAALKEGPRLFEDCSVDQEVDKERLFREMVSHNLIAQVQPPKFQATPLGLKMLEVW